MRRRGKAASLGELGSRLGGRLGRVWAARTSERDYKQIALQLLDYYAGTADGAEVPPGPATASDGPRRRDS